MAFEIWRFWGEFHAFHISDTDKNERRHVPKNIVALNLLSLQLLGTSALVALDF